MVAVRRVEVRMTRNALFSWWVAAVRRVEVRMLLKPLPRCEGLNDGFLDGPGTSETSVSP